MCLRLYRCRKSGNVQNSMLFRKGRDAVIAEDTWDHIMRQLIVSKKGRGTGTMHSSLHGLSLSLVPFR